MDADGSNPVRLTDNRSFDAWPSWSPSGDRIAFTSARGGVGLDIFVMEADGSSQDRLTLNEGLDSDAHPYWSPVGEQILYSSDEGDEFDPEVWVINADGTGKQQLTDNQAWDLGVSWYPDGSKILFLSDRHSPGEIDLYAMNPDGSEVTRLAFTPGIREEQATYSPDGTQIVVYNTLDQHLWAMDADGRNPRPITEEFFLTGYPYWEPNPEVPLRPFVIGASVAPEADTEGPGQRFPIDPSTAALPEEEHHTEYTTIPPTSGPYWS